MRVFRSWPASIPDNRNYVVDNLPRLEIAEYDMAPIADVGDDVIVIEWDLAVTREDLARFIDQAAEDPDRVRVAPYRLYQTTVGQVPMKETVWAHRRPDGTHVDELEPTCAFFGFGLIYFPHAVLEEFRQYWTGHFSDGSFSGWHRNNVSTEVPISWDVRPVHLHYDVREVAGLSPTPRPKRTLAKKSTPVDAAQRQAWTTEPARKSEIDALLRERAGYERLGKSDHVAEVNRQLVLRGYKEGT